jgi:hypothetical protein
VEYSPAAHGHSLWLFYDAAAVRESIPYPARLYRAAMQDLLFLGLILASGGLLYALLLFCRHLTVRR